MFVALAPGFSRIEGNVVYGYPGVQLVREKRHGTKSMKLLFTENKGFVRLARVDSDEAETTNTGSSLMWTDIHHEKSPHNPHKAKYSWEESVVAELNKFRIRESFSFKVAKHYKTANVSLKQRRIIQKLVHLLQKSRNSVTPYIVKEASSMLFITEKDLLFEMKYLH